MNITKKWVVEQGLGHWEVSNGKYSLSCDENELEETVQELEGME